jgi:hypothetical protein
MNVRFPWRLFEKKFQYFAQVASKKLKKSELLTTVMEKIDRRRQVLNNFWHFFTVLLLKIVITCAYRSFQISKSKQY